MARIITLRFTKDFETVADGLQTLVSNPVVTRRTEDEREVIDVEGDFEQFIIDDMDVWSLHLKFVIKDNRIQDEDDRDVRANLAEYIPGFGDILFSPTLATVYRRTRTKTRTQTVVEKVYEDGRIPVVLSRETNETEWSDEWEDITKEFGQKVRIDR